MTMFKYIQIVVCLLSVPASIHAGALQEIYQATYDMRDLFIATTTTLQADAAALKDELIQDSIDLKDELALRAVSLKAELQGNVFLLTGTPGMHAADPASLTTKEEIDAAQLSIFELLKTILYKLSLMTPA